MAVILKVWFWNSYHRIVLWALHVKLLSGECHRTSLMICQHRFRWWSLILIILIFSFQISSFQTPRKYLWKCSVTVLALQAFAVTCFLFRFWIWHLILYMPFCLFQISWACVAHKTYKRWNHYNCVSTSNLFADFLWGILPMELTQV